jgi:hypothetical protein
MPSVTRRIAGAAEAYMHPAVVTLALTYDER